MRFEIHGDFIFAYPNPDYDQADVLDIKKLPGRYYDESDDRWVIPIRPGLTKQLEKQNSFLGNSLAALIEEREAEVLLAMQAPKISQTDLWSMPASNALELAVKYHFYTVHHGDPQDYNKVHPPMRQE